MALLLTPTERRRKLETLAEHEGFAGVDPLIRAAVLDSVCPGICTVCDYTTEVEPDQRAGYCERCRAGTVHSALVLAELI